MSEQTPEFHRSLLKRYDRGATLAAHRVISSYSTSFSMATSLLSKQVRDDIRNLYAVVRIADEIVDGTAAASGNTLDEIATTLNAYEQAVLHAPQQRFHTDLILHAYAETARQCAFDNDHVQAFFASMRRDLTQDSYDPTSFNDYVYGSAEVIGLLCLSAFLRDKKVSPARRKLLDDGARSLGAAFQKINFLRDLGEDQSELGRRYFPGSSGELSEEQKHMLIDDIHQDLTTANQVIPLLPLEARAGVIAATALFTRLTAIIEDTPAEQLLHTRISVPRSSKLFLLGSSMIKALLMSFKKAKK